MQLKRPRLTDVPAILKHFELHTWEDDHEIAVAYHNSKHAHVFVHFGDNLFSDTVYEHIQRLCLANDNGINKNYVCFYSPMLGGQFGLDQGVHP
mgnify:CR=1 FL=1